MSNNFVFMICSKETGSRSGKDTVAHAMVSELVSSSLRARTDIIEFSYPLKWICKNFLGLDEEYFKGDLKEEPSKLVVDGKNISGRRAQQLMADFYRTTFGQDVFVSRVDRLVTEFYDEAKILGDRYNSFVFIPDFRFDNEFNYLKDKGHNIITINVIRPSNKKGITSHNSDHGLSMSNFDYVIVNDGSIKDLNKKCYDIIDEICLKHEINSFGCC